MEHQKSAGGLQLPGGFGVGMRARTSRGVAFAYKPGSTLVHRFPAWAKILLIPAVSVIFFRLPPIFSAFFVIFQLILAIFLRFSARELFLDFRAVLYYAALLIFVRVISASASGAVKSAFDAGGLAPTARTLLPEKETLAMLLKLLCVMQSAAIMFRTSTSLQIREGLEKIERTVRYFLRIRVRKSGRNSAIEAANKNAAKIQRAPVAQAVSLFICFIPQISAIWEQAKLAWLARGGRGGIRMYATLLPVLFSVGMKKAYNSARAISIRQ